MNVLELNTVQKESYKFQNSNSNSNCIKFMLICLEELNIECDG